MSFLKLFSESLLQGHWCPGVTETKNPEKPNKTLFCKQGLKNEQLNPGRQRGLGQEEGKFEGEGHKWKGKEGEPRTPIKILSLK